MTGPLADLDLTQLAVFTAGAFVAVAVIVVISSHFPRSEAPASGRGLLGATLLYASLAALVVLLVALVGAAAELPIAVAIVAAGVAVLAAPFLVDPLPVALRESRLGLLASLALCAIFAFTLHNNLLA